MKKLVRKSRYIVGIFALMLALMPVQPVQALPLYIDEDTEWSGTIELDRDVIVRLSAKLTILPGTQVIVTNSDQSNSGADPDLVEIKINPFSVLIAEGATFFRQDSSESWYGIVLHGRAEIKDSVIRDSVFGVNISFNTETVEITGNTIMNLRGKPGSNGSPNGGHATGINVIHTATGSVLIANNHIHNIQGGSGLAGSAGIAGGLGGMARGIHTENSGTIITGNRIEKIYGGQGGLGYDGEKGNDGVLGSALNPSGGDGQAGQDASAGGNGNLAAGIHVQLGAGVLIDSNTILDVTGGAGGNGGKGGDGGHGGAGVTSTAGIGGAGGAGGVGGVGGAGGNGSFAYGIYAFQTQNLIVTNNLVQGVYGGVPGKGGDGGVGGDGAVGGASNFIANIGGAGGRAGDGGRAGAAGNSSIISGIYFWQTTYAAPMDLSGNQVFDVTGTYGGFGGSGGSGGRGGDGGWHNNHAGITGPGGQGGLGGLGGDGSASNIVRALNINNINPSSEGQVVNNVIANSGTNQGGPGGVGGRGGDGGSSSRGQGGDGGNGGNGANGGITSISDLMLLNNGNLLVTNNTLHNSIRAELGGYAGGGGAAGAGGSGVGQGNDGVAGTNGSMGVAVIRNGLSVENGTFGVYNNIITMPEPTPNSYGIYQGSSAVITDGVNNIFNWSENYQGFSPSGQIIAANPLFADAVNNDFRLLSTSPCIEAGDNNAPARPDFDILGNPRPFDADGDGIAIVDLGAFEFFKEGSQIFLPLIVR